MSSKQASSYDDVDDVVWDNRKRTRKEFENEDESRRGAEGGKGENTRSVSKKEVEEALAKKDLEIQKFATAIKSQREAMKAMEEKAEMAAGVHKEDMKDGTPHGLSRFSHVKLQKK